MSYEDRAEKHERLLYRFFKLQRTYAALDESDPASKRERCRVARELTVLRVELERLRRAEDAPGTSAATPPPAPGAPATAGSSRPRARQVVARCVLCGLLASYGSWFAAERTGWRVLDVVEGQGVCPACIAADRGDPPEP